MHLLVHAELSWLLAQSLRDRRDRVLVVAAGMAPDLDGLGVLYSHDAYESYHHVLFHGIFAALLTALACGIAARRRWATGMLSLAAFHLHLLCDIAGSGRFWPIEYFWPVSRELYGWSHGWELLSWQNEVIGLIATVACLAAALRWRRTIVEVFSPRADARVVEAVRARFGAPAAQESQE
jgi:hypothetical protein